MFIVSVAAAGVFACSGPKSATQPTALRSGDSSSDQSPFTPPTSPPTVPGFNTTLSGDGEWAFATLNGIPATGCVTIDQLRAMNLPIVNGVAALQWEVIPSAGHPHAIGIVAQDSHKEIASCDGVDRQQPRDMDVIGHTPIVPFETGTTTLNFLTDRCRDGGRYEVDIAVAADFTDENPAIDRQAAQLIVNCGVNSPGF